MLPNTVVCMVSTDSHPASGSIKTEDMINLLGMSLMSQVHNSPPPISSCRLIFEFHFRSEKPLLSPGKRQTSFGAQNRNPVSLYDVFQSNNILIYKSCQLPAGICSICPDELHYPWRPDLGMSAVAAGGARAYLAGN